MKKVFVDATKHGQKFTGICYDDDCGFYAVVNGKVLAGGLVGISGYWEQAIARLADALDNGPAHNEPGYEYQFGPAWA